MLPRSTIQINPFAHVRRQLFESRTQEVIQLLEEIIGSLDDYICSFVRSVSPIQLSFETLDTNDLLAPCAPKVSASRLEEISTELDNGIAELSDKLPDFRRCLITGGYGPFYLPTQANLDPVGNRFVAYEPSHAEIINSSWWALRLRKDLSECRQGVSPKRARSDHGETPSSLLSDLPSSTSTAMDASQELHEPSRNTFHTASLSINRSDSGRSSADLLVSNPKLEKASSHEDECSVG